MVLTFSRLFSVEQPSIAEENEPQRTQRGGAATQTRPRNASHKEAQKAQKGIPFVALVPFCGQENLVGLKRFGGIAVQRTQRTQRKNLFLLSLRSLRSLRFNRRRILPCA